MPCGATTRGSERGDLRPHTRSQGFRRSMPFDAAAHAIEAGTKRVYNKMKSTVFGSEGAKGVGLRSLGWEPKNGMEPVQLVVEQVDVLPERYL